MTPTAHTNTQTSSPHTQTTHARKLQACMQTTVHIIHTRMHGKLHTHTHANTPAYYHTQTTYIRKLHTHVQTTYTCANCIHTQTAKPMAAMRNIVIAAH